MRIASLARRGLRLFHTLRHLRFRQIAYQFYYRFFFRTDKVAMPVKKTERGRPAPLDQNFDPGLSQLAPERQFFPPARFEFLNQRYEHPAADEINWNYSGYGKLWTYNQNYFEFLRHPELPTGVGEDLIDYWIRQSEHHRDGWEPYPTSLRVVHWLQFFRERSRELSPLVDLSLRRQYQDLWRKREYHLGGNHLLENAIALCICALYFGEASEFERAGKLLLAQLEEQYTQDGGHYERSPMYHCILLWRLLDLYSWHSAADQRQHCYFAAIKESLEKQIGWLNTMLAPNGNYPHFNDSTAGIAPDPKRIINYARQLGISKSSVTLSDSGYRHWRKMDADLWIDAGPIGPDHIPGHGHADNLTFVLARNGQKVIVDPGISTYKKSQRRHWERSTTAHNTVTIGDKNSSDVWAGFRVGKRAYTTIEAEADHELTASHDGFKFTHRRRFQLGNDQLLVEDFIGHAEGTARFYLAPGLREQVSGCSVKAGAVTFNFSGASISVAAVDYVYAAGYNLHRPARCIVVTFQQSLSSKMRW